MDNLPCTRDTERSERKFFMPYNSMYQNFNCLVGMVSLYFFPNGHDVNLWLWSIILQINRKVLNNTSVAYQKTIKHTCCGYTCDSNDECLVYAHIPVFKHFHIKKFKIFTQKLFISRSPCLVTHIIYLRWRSVFWKKKIRSFLVKTFRIPMCSITFCGQY